jgi:chromosome segregation ATPase
MGEASRGLMRLRPVTFRYKNPFADGSKPIQYGLIAEEVAEVYPDLVARSADGQIETVKYQVLDSMLLNEVQHQQTEISSQRNELSTQREQINTQRVEISTQREQISKQTEQIGMQAGQIRDLQDQIKELKAALTSLSQR